MEALALYLLKSGALIALFYLAYYFLLRKETFFISNRWFLLFGLVTSVLLPLVTYKKVVWIDPLPSNIDWANLPYATVTAPAEQGFEIDWMLVSLIVYAIGIFGFLLTFFMDFYSLNRALKGRQILRQADYRFVDTDDKIAPFSYFNYIVYNSSLYSEAELANIIEHEKVHSNQNHTMDVLFARFFCIVFWFNPFVWLYKKAMLQNLEFIADAEATKNIEDKKSYQITLLKVTGHENCVDITNHFYQSLIKKRIVMLNKNQSNRISSWKYFLIIPLLAAFLVYFQVKVVAQEKPGAIVLEDGATFKLDKNTTDAEMKTQAERLKSEHGVTLKCSRVKRN
ncbi:MAG: M56 family metallopeptidase, partial [Flavobacterium sp.]